MHNFKAQKGVSLYLILGSTILYNLIIVIILYIVNSYILSSLLKVLLLGYNIYQLYYILLSITLAYKFSEHKLYINGIWGFKKVIIDLKDIEGFNVQQGKIKGIRLWGYGNNAFALGKSVIHKIGTTNMFVTSNSNVVYLKYKDVNYAMSPENIEIFKQKLISLGIQQIEWEKVEVKDSNLHKQKRFMLPFMAVTIIILYITLNPFILYLQGKLPGKMPISFNSAFMPVQYGTGKQFAFSQMTYGALNMAVLFCMYYASFFYAKYDSKSAHRFIYIALIIAAFFLGMQLRILSRVW